MEKIFMGSGDLLNALYDNNFEKDFIKLCEKKLNKNIIFDDERCEYLVINKKGRIQYNLNSYV